MQVADPAPKELTEMTVSLEGNPAQQQASQYMLFFRSPEAEIRGRRPRAVRRPRREGP